MKILKKSPYLYSSVKQKWYIQLIRGLFYKYVNEIYIPEDCVLGYTYKGNGVHGLRLGRTGNNLGVQEYYFDEPNRIKNV